MNQSEKIKELETLQGAKNFMNAGITAGEKSSPYCRPYLDRGDMRIGFLKGVREAASVISRHDSVVTEDERKSISTALNDLSADVCVLNQLSKVDHTENTPYVIEELYRLIDKSILDITKIVNRD